MGNQSVSLIGQNLALDMRPARGKSPLWVRFSVGPCRSGLLNVNSSFSLQKIGSKVRTEGGDVSLAPEGLLQWMYEGSDLLCDPTLFASSVSVEVSTCFITRGGKPISPNVRARSRAGRKGAH